MGRAGKRGGREGGDDLRDRHYSKGRKPMGGSKCSACFCLGGRSLGLSQLLNLYSRGFLEAKIHQGLCTLLKSTMNYISTSRWINMLKCP